MRIAVTGANSSVGQNLLTQIVNTAEISANAGVRSESAFSKIPESELINPCVIDYDHQASLAACFKDVDCVVHLAGILIESKRSNYASANVAATRSVVQAAKQADVKHLIFISVIGASAASSNSYFKSKGDAESLVIGSGIGASIIRTPILIGAGTAGAASMLGAASQAKAKLLGGGNYTMRPLDVDDLTQAILRCCKTQSEVVETYELVGPEPIKYRDLITRIAELLGNKVVISSIPILMAKIGATLSRLLKGGGITSTVIDVITSDESVAENADTKLGLELTSLQSTLEKIIRNK